MTTQKLFALAGLILTLTLPSALLAGSVNGADWYSVEPGKTTNQIEQVIALDSSVARTGIGVDWHDGGEMMFMKPGINDRSSTEQVIGIGLDWHSEKAAIPAGDCLALGDPATGMKSSC